MCRVFFIECLQTKLHAAHLGHPLDMIKSKQGTVIHHTEGLRPRCGQQIGKQQVCAGSQCCLCAVHAGKTICQVFARLPAGDVDPRQHQTGERNLAQDHLLTAGTALGCERGVLGGQIGDNRRPGDLEPAHQQDIVRQFTTVAGHTFDPETELYRHAYDDSRAMFWCDSVTGQSAHAWCRAMGWYAMAIVETLQYLGVNPTTQPMVDILTHIYEVLPKYADPATGMWYQVLDCPGRVGNYLESTGSAMFVYAQLKGVRLGYLPETMRGEAMRRYEQFVERFVRENPDGTISLTDCCAVAGLGGKQMRSGTFEYYISEPVIENDCKGVGPFIWAAMEYDRAKGRLAD